MGVLDFFKVTIGIDPGSQHLRIIRDGAIIFNEPSQISFDKTSGIVSGLGSSIRSTGKDVTIRPVNCAIYDFHAFEMLLRGAVRKGLKLKSKIFSKSYIMYFTIPVSTSEVEKRAYRDAGEHANAVEVHMIHQSCCSAVGMNVLFERKHFILIDFGCSKIEMSVFANSVPISVGLIRMGTWKIFSLLRNFLKRKYKLEVSDSDVESLLSDLGQSKGEIRVQYVTVSVTEIQALIDSFFSLVNDEFIGAIEAVSDHGNIGGILANGIYFTGGGSTIDFLRDQIKLDGLHRTTSQDPLLDGINGLKKIMADRERYKGYIMM